MIQPAALISEPNSGTATNLDQLVKRLFAEKLEAALNQKWSVKKPMRIVLLGEEGLCPEEDHALCHSHDFVIFIVMTLSKQSLPYLKYADLLIFSSNEQAKLYEDVYVETAEYCVWNTPSAKNPHNEGDPLHVAVLCPESYSLGEYQRCTGQLRDLIKPLSGDPVESIIFISNTDNAVSSAMIHDIADTLKIAPNQIQHPQANNALAALQTVTHTYVFQQEDVSPYQLPNHASLIGTNLFRIVDFSLHSPLYSQLPEQSRLSAHSGIDDIVDKVSKTLLEAIQSPPAGTANTDSIEDLNIVYGRPLSNEFVISILYRNAGGKLLRAIESVLKQRGRHDVGIALLDDCSTDESLQPALALLTDSGIDCVVVQNQERKYAAKNYYNVIHSLTNNDASILIDLDGDDYLNPNLPVFDTLKTYYKDETTLKSIGSYLLFSDSSAEELNNNEFFQSMSYFAQDHDLALKTPWNLAQCPSWKHLRTTRRQLLRAVELEYFMERSKSKWLRMEHDISVHSRAIELSGGKVALIHDKLYVYDISGDNHDNHDQAKTKNSYIYKLYHAYTFDTPLTPTLTPEIFKQSLQLKEESLEQVDIDFI